MYFSTIVQEQEEGHCGPTSLSSCLGVLGRDITPADVRRIANKSFFEVKNNGMDEGPLMRVAKKLGVKCVQLEVKGKKNSNVFLNSLNNHIKTGNPALLNVDECGHWIALIGKDGKYYLTMDPNDDTSINRISEKRLINRVYAYEDSDGNEADQYYAILLSNADGRPARWSLTPKFIGLLNQGSEQKASTWYQDFQEMIERSEKNGNSNQYEKFSDLLLELKKDILDSIQYWILDDVADVDSNNLRSCFMDAVIIAESSNIMVGDNCDKVKLAMQLAVYFSTYYIVGELE